jgi:tripartite-type tricarboxylate transporter receptor subunit TctC
MSGSTSKRRGFLAGATALALAPAAHAQPKTTRILVGFAAGGGNDVIARILAQKLSEGPLGAVIVENKTGASGLIAADILAKSPPDGTMLMIASQTTYAVAPMLYRSVQFDAARDVQGVAMLGASPMALVVHPAFPAKSVRELVGMAKDKPGTINIGSGGVGTTPHMAAELFMFNAGIKMTPVAYRGEAPAITDLLSGQLPVLFSNLSVITSHIRAGTVRALAIASAKRAAALPDVPTIAEAGVPGYEVETWFGLTAPAATPREIVHRINAEVLKVLALPDIQQRFAELSIAANGSTPEALDATIRSEVVRWGDVIRNAGIRPIE